MHHSIAESFRQAERCFKGGDKALANMHLALTGLNALEDIDAGRERLLIPLTNFKFNLFAG